MGLFLVKDAWREGPWTLLPLVWGTKMHFQVIECYIYITVVIAHGI